MRKAVCAWRPCVQSYASSARPASWGEAALLAVAPDARHLPGDEGSEVAFLGRSNAGKSSALNAITGVPNLCRVSRTPGRTQTINFFALPKARPAQRLVDLPGYGFARVAKSTSSAWLASMREYLCVRRSLAGVVLVMDARHPLREADLEVVDFARGERLALHMLLTKADKLSPAKARETLEWVQHHTLDDAVLPWSASLFSALAGGVGVREARERIMHMMQAHASAPEP